MRLPVQTPSLIRNPRASFPTRARPAPREAGGIRPSQMDDGADGTEDENGESGDEGGGEEAGEGEGAAESE
jgi:hypothetical protein